MIKKHLLLIALSIILLSTTLIETRQKLKKCKPILPPCLPKPKCTDSSVTLVQGTNIEQYVECKDCFKGNDVTDPDLTKHLEHRLNSDLIFGSNGWLYGATVSPTSTTVGNNVLNLKYNNLLKYYFDSNTLKKYEIVISLQTYDCYTVFRFNCLSYTQLKDLIYTTTGIGNGMPNQTVMHVTYFYKECGTTPPVDCTKGTVTIGTNNYIDCENCINGLAYGDADTTKTLEYKLNTELIFTEGNWVFGASVSPKTTQGPNPLSLQFITGNSYQFVGVTNIKYKIVIAIQVDQCYSTYLFDCLTFQGVQNLLANTLGVYNGTPNQPILNIVYYVKECGYTIVDCTKGTVTVGGVSYTDCENCINGDVTQNTNPVNNLENQLNVVKIFGSNGWTFGAKQTQTTSTVGNDVLGLSYSALNGYQFTKSTTKKYEVVIAIKAGTCYVPYLFPCLAYDALKNIVANTLGVDKGTGQPIDYVAYFYKECGTTPPCVSNPTTPKETGQTDCVNYGTVDSLLGGKYFACWGSYSGNLDHDGCTQDNNKGEICLYRVLNATPSVCNIEWCFVEKLDTNGDNTVVGTNFSLSVIPGTDTRKGTYTLQPWITGPYIITLKASNEYSAYIVSQGLSGTWETFNHGLSHASLWMKCPPANPTFLQLESK